MEVYRRQSCLQVFLVGLNVEFDEIRGQIWKLKRSLYGLKQSPRAWFECFEKTVMSYKFSQSQVDHMIMTLVVYVDIILIGNE